MNKKEFITKEKVEEVAKFLQESVEWLKAQDEGCRTYPLDDNLVIAIGWSNGFNMANEDIIKSPNGQSLVNNPSHPWVCGWAIDAAVKIKNDHDCSDFEALNFPYWDNDNGECWDSSLSIRPNLDLKGYKEDAKQFLEKYVDIVNEAKKKNSTLVIGG